MKARASHLREHTATVNLFYVFDVMMALADGPLDLLLGLRPQQWVWLSTRWRRPFLQLEIARRRPFLRELF